MTDTNKALAEIERRYRITSYHPAKEDIPWLIRRVKALQQTVDQLPRFRDGSVAIPSRDRAYLPSRFPDRRPILWGCRLVDPDNNQWRTGWWAGAPPSIVGVGECYPDVAKAVRAYGDAAEKQEPTDEE